MKLSLPVNSKLTKYVIGLVLCVCSAKAVADAGFIEGGFCISIAREKVGATPTFTENHASVLERSFLSYLPIPSFSIKIFAKAC